MRRQKVPSEGGNDNFEVTSGGSSSPQSRSSSDSSSAWSTARQLSDSARGSSPFSLYSQNSLLAGGNLASKEILTENSESNLNREFTNNLPVSFVILF